MASKTYRFEYRGPTEEDIEPLVTGDVTASGISGTPLQRDWSFDDQNTDPADLMDALQTWGWVFVGDVTP